MASFQAKICWKWLRNSENKNYRSVSFLPYDAHQGAGHADHTSGNGAEFVKDPLSFSSGPITRLRAKRFKEALNGLVQEIWADSRNPKMGSNNNQGLVHVIKAIEEANACKFTTSMV